jgi:hypothetical protein
MQDGSSEQRALDIVWREEAQRACLVDDQIYNFTGKPGKIHFDTACAALDQWQIKLFTTVAPCLILPRRIAL